MDEVTIMLNIYSFHVVYFELQEEAVSIINRELTLVKVHDEWLDLTSTVYSADFGPFPDVYPTLKVSMAHFHGLNTVTMSECLLTA